MKTHMQKPEAETTIANPKAPPAEAEGGRAPAKAAPGLNPDGEAGADVATVASVPAAASAGDAPDGTDGPGDPEAGEAAQEPRTIDLPGIVDLPRAGDLYEQIAGCQGQPLRIDASQVQFIGTPAFQVLLAAAASWQAAGADFELCEISAGFRACGARLGIGMPFFAQGAPA
jgi:anti-anti-sigma regulatory factor